MLPVSAELSNIAVVVNNQNLFLWNRYCRERDDMSVLNGQEHVNERLLFHGTNAASPSVIYEGYVGFDIRKAGANLFYGRGIYFAESASYVEGTASPLRIVLERWLPCVCVSPSGRYAHQQDGTSSAQYQVLLARVLCGFVKDYGLVKDTKLTRPPERIPNRLYDSIQVGVPSTLCGVAARQQVLLRPVAGRAPRGLVPFRRQGDDYASHL